MTPLWIKLGVIVCVTFMAFGQYFAFRNARGKGFADAFMWGFAWPYLITYCWWHGHFGEFRRVPRSTMDVHVGRCFYCGAVICMFPNGTDMLPPGASIIADENNKEFAQGFYNLHGVTIKQALGEEDAGPVHPSKKD